MITLIILIVLVAIGIYLTTTYDYDLLGILITCICGIWLILHISFWASSSYTYRFFVEKRNAFEQTLNVARESGNEYETAAIIKEVTQWNIQLAGYKFNNNTFYIGQYVDDRFELLEPIK